jgi:hypothetical protein
MTTLREAAEKALHALERFIYWDEKALILNDATYDELREALDAESMAEPVLTLRRVDGDWLVSHGGQELNFGTSVTISLDALGIVRCDSQEKVVAVPTIPAYPHQPLTDDQVMDIVDVQRAKVAFDAARVGYRVARAIERAHGIGGAHD